MRVSRQVRGHHETDLGTIRGWCAPARGKQRYRVGGSAPFVSNRPENRIGMLTDERSGRPELPGHRKLARDAGLTTGKCATLPARERKGESLPAVEIELDVRSWVKNVLIPALVDEFIEENGKVSG